MVADVSQTVRLMLDLVRNVGDLSNNEQPSPSPDTETLIALGPEMPDGGPKARLNLSTYFPVPDEDNGDSIEEAMTYHDTICASVKDVRCHLEDISDLKAIAETLPYGAKLVVVNNTVSEYMNEVNKKGNNLMEQYQHPSVVLIGRCAGGKGANWEEFGAFFAGQFGARDVDSTMKLSCPMVVSHDAVAQESCPFPVAELGAFPEIGFVPMPRGGDHLTSKPDALIVQNAIALLSMPAAMAVAPMLQKTALGKFPDKAMELDTRRAVEEYAGVTFHPGNTGEWVVEFLRRCWRESKTNTMLEAFVTARLATLALARSSSDYRVFHRECIAAGEKDGHPALAGTGDLLGVDIPSLHFLVIMGNAPVPLEDESERLCFFNDKVDVRLKIGGVKKTSGDYGSLIGWYLRKSQNRLQSELESSFLAISFRMGPSRIVRQIIHQVP